MDINMSNNKVVNVANPIDAHDAATKSYTDLQIQNLHNLTPITDEVEYARYINLRNITLHSLAGVVNITTDLTFVSKHPKITGIPHTWIESPTCTMSSMLEANKDLKGKNITIEFKYPVNVKEWSFWMIINPYEEWEIAYKWEVSHNGDDWHEWTPTKPIKTGKYDWNGNNAKLAFKNAEYGRSKFWRVLIGAGKTEKLPIYINYLKLEVT